MKELKKTKTILRQLLLALFFGITSALFCFFGVLYPADAALSDRLYQHTAPTSGEIILIGINEDSFQELGAFSSWGRATMGDIIEALNADPNRAPAVIGIDVLYVGDSEDPEGDAWLAQAAAESTAPVVVACAAAFGEQLSKTDNAFYMDTNALLALEYPYNALLDASFQGHINAFADRDGILRHGLYEIETDTAVIPSFHQMIYSLYCDRMGIAPESRFVPERNSDQTFYVPFFGKPGDFYEGIGVHDILNGSLNPDFWADKIVLIGPYASGMQDDYLTAADHAEKMYGIEYQANILEGFLQQTAKKESSRSLQALLTGLLTAVLVFWMQRTRIRGTILLLIAGTAGSVLAAYGLYQLGWVCSLLYLPLFTGLGFVYAVICQALIAAMEKRKVTKTFQRYVAPEIVQELLKEGTDASALGGTSCEIAVLFVDIRGFTSMSEILSPAEVVEILNQYLTLTSESIFRNRGTLDKFVGDCTMAFWGAPLPQPDPIYQAVKTAFDMVEGSVELKKHLLERFGRTVDFGIGVHFGEAIVGNIGSPNRMDYTAIGDTVNTASRLESNAPAGTIYVSRVVADALEGRVEFESLGDSVALKGKAAGFEVLKAIRLLEQ